MSDAFAHSFRVNRARWDELADLHRRSPFYGIDKFRAGDSLGLSPIEAAEIGDVAGKRLVHLQCHIGLDTLYLARRGARATGLDFSPRAIAAARDFARESGLPTRFVEGNLYDALDLIPERFDVVYVTWGAICWLPDIARWAAIVATLLVPGGFLYLADGHPAAQMLEQDRADGPIESRYDYHTTGDALVFHQPVSYSGDADPMRNTEEHNWIHPLGAIINGLLSAGLALEFLHEHEVLPWRLFPCMSEGPDRKSVV
jgi:SAM-dependent methyltransferase